MVEEKLFRVIDTRTGKAVDCNSAEQIAIDEEWAENLVYCDLEGFAVESNGDLILVDECGNFAYPPEGRFKIEWIKWD